MKKFIFIILLILCLKGTVYSQQNAPWPQQPVQFVTVITDRIYDSPCPDCPGGKGIKFIYTVTNTFQSNTCIMDFHIPRPAGTEIYMMEGPTGWNSMSNATVNQLIWWTNNDPIFPQTSKDFSFVKCSSGGMDGTLECYFTDDGVPMSEPPNNNWKGTYTDPNNDPIGFINVEPIPPLYIPTLSQWGLIIFGSLLLITGVVFVWRRFA